VGNIIAIKNLSIKLVENDEDLLDVALLRKAHDSEFVGKQMPEGIVLERTMEYKRRGYDFWIARDNQIPVGYSAGIRKGKLYESGGIYVVLKKRGNGIAPKLKLAQIDYAKNLGCNEFWSFVDKSNKASKRIHEKTGFEEESVEGTQLLRFLLSLRD